MNSDIKVISLDLDGVLFDGPSAAYPVAKALGIGDLFAKESMRFSQIGLSIEERLVQGAKIWQGVPVIGEEMQEIINDIPLMQGAEDVIDRLKEWNYRVGCISSGVSQFFMTPFIERLDLDFGYSNILEGKDGKHTGEILYTMGSPQKAESILRYLSEIGARQENLVSVGDGLNDLGIFKVSSLSIAFNPEHDEVSKAATHTVHSKDLRDILQYLESML
jgi:HAD superfamily phosphoserine phosphatase-like hydrolase